MLMIKEDECVENPEAGLFRVLPSYRYSVLEPDWASAGQLKVGSQDMEY
jgi:hypothetical protein